ncbi:MAG: hypothetical protein QNJ54_17055 [Prochloraceae cyanobacterium]|nr:hypothetical protein [Prochloraceae cyanobacterium]
MTRSSIPSALDRREAQELFNTIYTTLGRSVVSGIEDTVVQEGLSDSLVLEFRLVLGAKR